MASGKIRINEIKFSCNKKMETVQIYKSSGNSEIKLNIYHTTQD